ncbi:hypothetical protein [Bradyrhizobium uaiense]|uniref:hypothetical protein n=1 Tax=Bradyrhizobium uaiense TaxID=2594946 RepID=UPI0013D2E3AD|nr:hypothetical protein [Bradyrhizobium uaiense]
MYATTLEAIQATRSKRAAYTRGMLALLAIAVLLKAAWFSRLGLGQDRDPVDFDAFYIVARLVWQGTVDQAYHFAKLVVMQREASGGHDSFMPWTYPPQFSLLLAPFALIPIVGKKMMSTSTNWLPAMRRSTAR